MDRRDFMVKAGIGASALAIPALWPRKALTASGVAAADGEGRLSLSSPSGKVEATFWKDSAGRLLYEVKREGRTMVAASRLGITVDKRDLGAGVALPGSLEVVQVEETYPLRAWRAQMQNRYAQAVIPVRTAAVSLDWQLEVRVYDGGAAWRYLVPLSGAMAIEGEATSFTLPAGATAFFQTNLLNYEGIWQGKPVEQVSGELGMPVTAKLADNGGYVMVTEAALYNYSGMTLAANADRSFRAVFADDSSFRPTPGPDGRVISPWRVVMAVASLNELINEDLLPNLNPPPPAELFADAGEWVKPGRALWSWWSEGTGTPELQREYMEAAKRLGFEYVLLDEGWEFWGGLGLRKWEVLQELAEYGRSQGVKLWVWKRWTQIKGEAEREDFFTRVKAAGAVGVKIDFMDRESLERIHFYESALRDAARQKLLVNFHGANKSTGEWRTYPNELTREGIRGLEYNKALPTNPAHHHVIFPFTRGLGPADYTPTTFNPAHLGPTTFAHQLAMPIAFLSPLTHYADKPENYLDNPATAPALDVLKSIPTVWDETVVPTCAEIGKLAVFARRSGKRWFVGAMAGDDPVELKVPLTFLGPGAFKGIVLTDPATGFGFKREEKKLGADALISASLRAGGGLVAMIWPEG